MKRNYTIIPLSLLLLIAMVACSNKSKGTTDSEEKQPGSTVSVPQFDADSAYRYVKAQVDFGPRVPNTAAHKACGEYLAKKLEQFGATVYNQQADLIAYDGTLLKARNIIGSYKPETKKRIVLLSHWDSRPWADADPDETKRHTPILGANDGASGVGVLLEIARQLHKQLPELGIDIVLVDAEDYGPHQSYTGNHKEEYWGARLAILGAEPSCAGIQRTFRHSSGHGGRQRRHFLLRKIFRGICQRHQPKSMERRQQLRLRPLFRKRKREYRNGRPPFCIPECTDSYHRHHSIQRGNRILRELAYPEG